jgi:hypothetical protein
MFLADGTKAYSTLWRHGKRMPLCHPDSPRTVVKTISEVESDTAEVLLRLRSGSC